MITIQNKNEYKKQGNSCRKQQRFSSNNNECDIKNQELRTFETYASTTKKQHNFKLLAYTYTKKGRNNPLLIYGIKDVSQVIAFAIFISKDNNKTIYQLNELLRNRSIRYYSIHIDLIRPNEKLFILCFEDDNTEKILRAFYDSVSKLKPANFLMDELLEERFLTTIREYGNFKAQLLKKEGCTKILTSTNKGNYIKFLYFYKLNLNLKIEKRHAFIHNFIKFLKNKNQSGHIIFNLSINDDDIIEVNSYYANNYDDISSSEDIIESTNNFFSTNLLERYRSPSVGRLLWRNKLKNTTFNYNNSFDELKKIFLKKDDNVEKVDKTNEKINDINNSLDIPNLIKQSFTDFNNILITANIEYTIVKENLYLINKKTLFYIIERVDVKTLSKIVKKCYGKYYLYIVVYDKEDYNSLLTSENLSKLKNIKILDEEGFLELDLNNLNIIS